MASDRAGARATGVGRSAPAPAGSRGPCQERSGRRQHRLPSRDGGLPHPFLYRPAGRGEAGGVYTLGKAAALNGRIGDVLMPSVVHDEQSRNTFLFRNCFSASDVTDHLVYGTALDNQKAVTVRGTFLQTPRYMDVFYREGYTDIEMEAGPYLSAVYEIGRA